MNKEYNPHKILLIIRNSWSISWPMILIMLMDFFIGITDVFIAGKLGKEVQGAIGFVSQFYIMFMVIINGITVGAVSVISRLFGAKKEKELSQAVYTILILSIVAGIILGILGTSFAGPGIRLLNIPESIRKLSIPLVQIYMAGILFHYFLITSNGVLRSCKRVKHSLFTMSIVCILNIGLNFALVFLTPLNYYGIVLSTIISYAAGSFINGVRMGKLCVIDKTFNPDLLRKMVRIGWPTGLQQIAWQAGGTVLFLIISLLPENTVEVIAALTNGLRIEAAIYVLAYALNNANAVIVGNLLGENNNAGAYRSGIVTSLLGVAIITLQTVLVILSADWISGALSPNRIVINETMRYLYIVMLSEPFMAWSVIISGALIGAGDTRTVMKIVVTSQWILRLPLAYFLITHFKFGPSAVWWAMNSSILFHAVFVSIRYFRKRWLYNDL